MTEIVAVHGLSSTWACARAGCEEPLTIVTRGATYDAHDLLELRQARDLMDGAYYIHGSDADAPARWFSFQELILGVQEGWIMACHDEKLDGEKVSGQRKRDIPEDVTDPKPVPARAPVVVTPPLDPRRQGPSANRPASPR